MRLIILLALVYLSSCSPIPPLVRVKTKPVYVLSPQPTSILLLNTYDVKLNKFRDNKEALFIRYIDSVLATAASEISNRIAIPTEVLRGVTRLTSSDDSSIASFMEQHNASHAIVLEKFNMYFDQTNVEVTKTSTGKEREAFYDIVSEMDLSLYNNEGLFKQLSPKAQRFHSSRSVMSGILAAGPNIVVQKKDAWSITLENLTKYLNLFFESN